MNRRLQAAMFCFVLLVAGPAVAQFVQDPDDLGAADTIDMVFSLIPDAATNQLQVQMDLYVFNDMQDLGSMAVGFVWDNPNLQMDSAYFTAEAGAAFDMLQFLYFGDDINQTNVEQKFQFSGVRMGSSGLLASAQRKHIASYHLTLSDWSVSDSIVIDTLAYSGGTIMKLVDVDHNMIIPYWTGKKVVHDTAFTAPSSLLLSEDTLFFDAVEGYPNPPPQDVDITSDNEPLDFSLIETASWLFKTPSSGTTPETISVSVVAQGLSPGTYFDSIRVEAPDATNSPQFLYVELVLIPPPPAIGVSSDAFFFNAIAGGADPPPQTLTITNTGESTLNWSVSNSKSWLDLFPGSGVDSGDVTLTVDISGLSYDNYYDTIVVSDPNASNHPVRIPVQLTVGSDLPVIEVDSLINYWVVDRNEQPHFLRFFGVRNGGGGQMNFWVEENTSRIMDHYPSSPVPADDSAFVVFWIPIDVGAPHDPVETTDTVWVYSNEAINSPVPVILNLRLVENPAVIVLSTDTLVIDIYECDQGFEQDLPSADFTVTNGGADDPTMMAELGYESDLFDVSDSTGHAPVTFTVTGQETSLPLGTYYDSITVVSRWATNSPQYVVVEYNLIPGDQPPEMVVVETEITIPYKENSGPQANEGIGIFNLYGGCMPWEVVEGIDWLVPESSDGEVPGEVPFIINPAGYAIGGYEDSLSVTAATAANSPQWVRLLLQIWRIHGDVTWDGQVDISDVQYLIAYTFMDGPEPMPFLLIGDCDCDGVVDITDMQLLIDNQFISMNPLPDCD